MSEPEDRLPPSDAPSDLPSEGVGDRAPNEASRNRGLSEADDMEGLEELPPLRPGGEDISLAEEGALRLEDDGFRLIESRGLKRSRLHAYDEITHIYASGRNLLVGVTDDLLTIRAEDFDDPARGPHYARVALLGRIETEPEGGSQLAAMAEVDAIGEQDGPAWAVWTAITLCLLGTAVQILDPMFDQVGSFIPDLFLSGEYWRATTSHFLHDLSVPRFIRNIMPGIDRLPIHLVTNIGGLIVLGNLIERPLGPWRTAIVLVLSGVGSILGILAYGHLEVLGASGLVAGLAGAMLAFELHFAHALPAFWRLPRKLFLFVLAAQFLVIDQIFSSTLAGGAHLGGFMGGYLATWWMGAPRPTEASMPGGLRFGAICGIAFVGLGVTGAMPLARHEIGALERHATRLYDTKDSPYLVRQDNLAAWLIATDGTASPHGLDLAVALAERAVVQTGRFAPGILDTLAETLFQRGDALGAVFVIEEAIRLSPSETYYYEQRRRFTGERAPDDRPEPPGESEAPPPEANDPGEASPGSAADRLTI